MVISFVELCCCLLVEESPSPEYFPKNPGCFGSGNSTSLTNIKSTLDIPGLSSGFCWTHKRLTWRQCNICDWKLEFSRLLSTSSSGLPFFQSSHAWKPLKLLVIKDTSMFDAWVCNLCLITYMAYEILAVVLIIIPSASLPRYNLHQ